MNNNVSVIMPVFNQCHFVRRAILSLQNQTMKDWELIIVNDGSTDDLECIISDILNDGNVKYVKNETNKGLGYSLNQGLMSAKNDIISYLPADDYYYPNHLESVKKIFDENKNCILAFSGMRYEMCDTLFGVADVETDANRRGYSLQLIQTSHRKCEEYWTERKEWISDDLYAMFWNKLSDKGLFLPTHEITCFWTQHPHQRHKIINEKFGGGINKIRSYFKIAEPIRLKVSKEKFTDEGSLYKKFRKVEPKCCNYLKILIVGELSYNPERIYALEQAGHQLYGLWLPNPNLSFFTVGHLPFGHVIDISSENWQNEVKKINPDIIYGLLNWGTIGWCYQVMKSLPEYPFAWHFKEGPYLSIRLGDFDKLIYLYTNADLRIYINRYVKQWFDMFVPQNKLSMLMDGDLPKKDYFKNTFSKKLSSEDGDVHTVVAGRLIGIGRNEIDILAKNKIHIHLYIENFHSSKEKLFESYQRCFPKYFHIHKHCNSDNWTKEFSKYDAGWLHCIKSNNKGNIMCTTWDDLNYPARMSTYAAAGLPMIQYDNGCNIVATEKYLREKNIGVIYKNLEDLVDKLKDIKYMEKLQNNIMFYRYDFCFDNYLTDLINNFRRAINLKKHG